MIAGESRVNHYYQRPCFDKQIEISILFQFADADPLIPYYNTPMKANIGSQMSSRKYPNTMNLSFQITIFGLSISQPLFVVRLMFPGRFEKRMCVRTSNYFWQYLTFIHYK